VKLIELLKVMVGPTTTNSAAAPIIKVLLYAVGAVPPKLMVLIDAVAATVHVDPADVNIASSAIPGIPVGLQLPVVPQVAPDVAPDHVYIAIVYLFMRL
jgi:hypothetical protein